MSQIKPVRVRAVSGDNVLFPVSNVLDYLNESLWLSCFSLDKEVSAEFEFESFVDLASLEVTNSDSAFVEIFVLDETDDVYYSLLFPTPLMTSRDAIDDLNGNKKQTFTRNDFVEQNRCRKWKKIKVICTQPFNKSKLYGLSSLKFTGVLLHNESIEKKPNIINIDITKLIRKDNTEECEIGSLFRSRQTKMPSISLESMNYVDNENKTSFLQIPNKFHEIKIAHAKNESSNQNNFETKEKQNVIEDANKESYMQMNNFQENKLQKPSITQTNDIVIAEHVLKTEDIRLNQSDDVLKEVTFVLSGYQNPLRNQLRDKGILMGAKYQSSWTNGSTHLICAFPNTPKFKEVCGKAIIVSEKWIIDCYTHKTHLPWRKYRVKGAPSPVSSLEFNRNVKRSSCQVPEGPSFTKNRRKHCAKEYDTDDEIENMNKDKELDESSVQDSCPTLNDLPSLFSGIKFFLYKIIEYQEIRKLSRLINVFGGEISEYMNSDVTLVITTSPWDESFDEALFDNPKLEFIHPNWVYECDKSHHQIPLETFYVKKN